MGRNAGHRLLDLGRPDYRFGVDGFVLDGCDPPGLFLAHAMLGEQPYAPEPRRRRRFQHERLVARAVPIDRLGRELAPEPSHARWFRAPRTSLVSDRHRLVFHLDAPSPCLDALPQAPTRFIAVGVTAGAPPKFPARI